MRAISAQVIDSLGTHALLGGNDVAWLLHRSKWAVLARMRAGRLRCHPRCDGRSMPAMRHNWDGYNEYCLLASELAESGVLHVETSHPREKRLRLQHLHQSPTPAVHLLSTLSSQHWMILRPHDNASFVPRRRPWLAGGATPAEDDGAAELAQAPPMDRDGLHVGFLESLRSHSLPWSAPSPERRPAAAQDGAPPSAAPVTAPHHLEALAWYVSSVLMGGVVCRRAAPTDSHAVESDTIECAACTNLGVLETARAREWKEVLGAELAKLQRTRVAVDHLLNRSAHSLGFACPEVSELGHPSAWAAEYPSHAMQDAERSRRKGALQSLGLGELSEAESACGVLAGPAETASAVNLHPGCSKLIALHPLNEGAGQSLDVAQLGGPAVAIGRLILNLMHAEKAHKVCAVGEGRAPSLR